MDPKTLASLDPKLKETYERVMGTSANVNPQTTPTAPQTITTSPPTITPTTQEPSTAKAEETIPPVDQLLTTNPFEINTTLPTAPQNETIPDSTPTVLNPDGLSSTPQNPTTQQNENLPPVTETSAFTFNQNDQKIEEQPMQQAAPIIPPSPPATTSPLLKILYIVAGVIFFLIYTFFWLKLFKFPLPF